MKEYDVLIADDERSAREYLLGQIAWDKLGISRRLQAADGIETLEMIEREHPDIVILDIKMPGKDGIQVLNEIQERYKEIRVIALSGYSSVDAARKMLSSGVVVDYLRKPASEDMIVEAICKCIEGIEERREFYQMRQILRDSKQLSQINTGITTEESAPKGSKAMMVYQVKRYLQDNYAKRITLDMVAREVYVNPTYLSKAFSDVEGVGFSEYLALLRIQQAKQLLGNYRTRIYQVAEEVGYPNIRHFIKIFKKLEGMTPTQYREKIFLV